MSYDPAKGRIKVVGRLSYFNGWKKTASVQNGPLKYRTSMLFDPKTKEGKQAIAVIEEALEAIVEKDFPGKDYEKVKAALTKKERWPLMDGDTNTDDDGEVKEHYEGMMYVKLSNDRKPKYKDRRGEDTDEDDDLLASGVYAIAFFHLYSVKGEDKGGNGIFSTLDGLQYYRDGERFAGSGMNEDEFDDLGEDGEDDDDFDDKKSSGKSNAKASTGKRRPADDDEDDI
jgi:hypothetical protein